MQSDRSVKLSLTRRKILNGSSRTSHNKIGVGRTTQLKVPLSTRHKTQKLPHMQQSQVEFLSELNFLTYGFKDIRKELFIVVIQNLDYCELDIRYAIM